jgi:hypothetical protein
MGGGGGIHFGAGGSRELVLERVGGVVLLLPDLGLLPPVFLDTLPLRLAHKRVSVFAPLALIPNFAIKLAHTASNIRHDTTRRKRQ